jgi:hypothetical protein
MPSLPGSWAGVCARCRTSTYLSTLSFPVIYALQGHEFVFGPILAPYLKSAVLSGAWDGDVKGAELAQEEEQRRTQAAELSA